MNTEVEVPTKTFNTNQSGNFQTVESSNIEKIGYDKENATLHVVFITGAHYIYRDVPGEVYEKLMAADSHGKFLNSEIKGKYAYERIG